MRCINRTTTVVLLTLGLSACSPASQPTPSADDKQQPTALEERYRPVERAKAVEAEVLEQKRKQDAEIEKQGG